MEITSTNQPPNPQMPSRDEGRRSPVQFPTPQGAGHRKRRHGDGMSYVKIRDNKGVERVCRRVLRSSDDGVESNKPMKLEDDEYCESIT